MLNHLEFAIIFAVLVIVSASLYYVFNTLRKDPKKRRRSDRRFSRREVKTINVAKQMAKSGKYVQASLLLHSLGLNREAITLLEESGNIDEAAGLLIKMQRPNRAGALFTRHGKWRKAMRCFEKASMYLEMARCARECGEHEIAATNFLKMGHESEAASCFSQAGDHRKAARYYAKAGNDEKAAQKYIEVFEQTKEKTLVNPERDELDFLVEMISRGHEHEKLTETLVENDLIADAVINLIRFGKGDQAEKLYRKSPTEIAPKLIEAVGMSDKSGKTLAQLFSNIGKPLRAGRVYEKIGLMGHAADCYEQAESTEDAERCRRLAAHSPSNRKPKRSFQSTQEQTKQLSFDDTRPLEKTTEFDSSSENLQAYEQTSNLSPFMDEAAMLAEETLNQTKSGPIPVADLREDEGAIETKSFKKKPKDLPAPPPPEASVFDPLQGEVFNKAKILFGLHPIEKQEVWQLGHTQEFETDQEVLPAGATPAGIYFVLSGIIRVEQREESTNEARTQIYPGETFGTHWTLLDELTDAAYKAEEATKVHVVSRDKLKGLLDNNPTLTQKMYKNMTRQIRLESVTHHKKRGFGEVS